MVVGLVAGGLTFGIFAGLRPGISLVTPSYNVIIELGALRWCALVVLAVELAIAIFLVVQAERIRATSGISAITTVVPRLAIFGPILGATMFLGLFLISWYSGT